MPLRRSILVLSGLFATVALHAPVYAQMHKVEAPEHVTRAIAVYEWTGDMAKPTASRVVPVSLFIDSHFEDAGVYLARPVPLALESGDVYEVESAGQPLGTLDLDGARNSVARRSPADDEVRRVVAVVGDAVDVRRMRGDLQLRERLLRRGRLEAAVAVPCAQPHVKQHHEHGQQRRGVVPHVGRCRRSGDRHRRAEGDSIAV